jgi:hypothetical protein
MTSKYPELDGLKGVEYRKAWNKLHRETMILVQKRFRERHPEMHKQRHAEHMSKYKMAETSRVNIPYREKATNSFQRWCIHEDKILMSGQYTQSECALKLGRSLRAVMNRKHKLVHNLV